MDSAKIKGAFYTTDIDILRVASMHRIVTSIHINESLHPYSVPPELKKKACHRDVFIFLVPTWYRSTGSFDNTMHTNTFIWRKIQ